MSQPNTFESFCQLLNASDAWIFEDEAPKTEGLKDLGTEPSNKSTEPGPAGNNSGRRKRVFFTQQQVRGLETFFEASHIPSRSERKDLGRVLGLTPLQVRLWFEKRRKKLKFESTEHENALLKAENEKLQAENAWYREALDTPCPKCGGKITLEDDMNAIFAITSKYVEESSASNHSHSPASSRFPYPYQTQLAAMEPTPMPSEKESLYHPEWSYPDDELAAILGQFNAETPKL